MSVREAKAVLERASETHDSGIFGTINDRISTRDVDRRLDGLGTSLMLVKVSTPEFQWGKKWNQKRVVFDHCGVTYDFAMTFEDSPRVGQSQSDWYFTVSLGEPYYGDCYKLVATAIEMPRE